MGGYSCKDEDVLLQYEFNTRKYDAGEMKLTRSVFAEIEMNNCIVT